MMDELAIHAAPSLTPFFVGWLTCSSLMQDDPPHVSFVAAEPGRHRVAFVAISRQTRLPSWCPEEAPYIWVANTEKKKPLELNMPSYLDNNKALKIYSRFSSGVLNTGLYIR